MNIRTKLFLCGAVAASVASQLNAQITAVNSAAALPTTDTIDWGQLGSTYSTFSSPQTVTSAGGFSATIGDNGNLERRDEGNGWSGNFPNGEHLIWNQDNQNAITIDFATPITGAGAQVSADTFGPFVATLSAFDDHGNLLGTEVFNGDNGGDPAIFAGLDSSSADISSISFTTDEGQIALGTLDLNLTPAASAPDAGATVGLLGLAFAGLGALRRKLA